MDKAKDYIDSLTDEQALQDTQTLIEIMHQISGSKPQLWNVGTLGFDAYHYKYDSKREGDCFIIGFYPKKR